MIKLPYYKKVTEDVPVGDSKMLRIRLNPKYENHEGTVTHEETHIQHWYIGFIICLCIAIAVSFVWGVERSNVVCSSRCWFKRLVVYL